MIVKDRASYIDLRGRVARITAELNGQLIGRPPADRREQFHCQPPYLPVPIQVIIRSPERQPILGESGKPDPDPA